MRAGGGRLAVIAAGLLTRLALTPAIAAPTPGAQAPASDEPDFGRGERPGKSPGDDFDFGEADADAGQAGAQPPTAPPAPARSSWSLTGFVRSDYALWTERLADNPFAKGRQSLDLTLRFKRRWFRILLGGHAEVDLAYLVERDSYDGPTLDSYEWLVNTREALVALSPGAFEITLGRQIVAWGEGDAFSPLDLVNPRDLREPGLADLDDVRLPVLATRVGWFRGAHRVEAMVVHESDFGYRSPPLGPFSPLRALIAGDPVAGALLVDRQLRYEHAQQRFDLEQQQLLLRWVYKGPGIDFSIQLASVLDQQGVVQFDLARVDLAARELALTLDHRRYTVGGYAGALPLGAFVLKWEVSAEFGRAFNVGAPPANLATAETDLLNTMAALTWTGIDDLTVTLELWKPWLINEPADLLFDANAPLGALRASYQLLRQRLTLSLAATANGWTANLGWLVRGEAQYELRDGLKLTAGYITYQPGDKVGLLYGLSDHDRFFARLRWDFQLL